MKFIFNLARGKEKSSIYSLTLRKEYGLNLFEIRFLRKIFPSKAKKEKAHWKELSKEELQVCAAFLILLG
jgi:hypothetical protein